jgi:thiosulfate dehydrogenase
MERFNFHTAKYLGPNGSVKKISNGMNCSNCHLDAGTKAWGNNYGSVFSQYPKNERPKGKWKDFIKRINDCLERSLNVTSQRKTKNESHDCLY